VDSRLVQSSQHVPSVVSASLIFSRVPARVTRCAPGCCLVVWCLWWSARTQGIAAVCSGYTYSFFLILTPPIFVDSSSSSSSPEYVLSSFLDLYHLIRRWDIQEIEQDLTLVLLLFCLCRVLLFPVKVVSSPSHCEPAIAYSTDLSLSTKTGPATFFSPCIFFVLLFCTFVYAFLAFFLSSNQSKPTCLAAFNRPYDISSHRCKIASSFDKKEEETSAIQ